MTYPVVTWTSSYSWIAKLASSSMLGVILNIDVISVTVLTKLAFCSLFNVVLDIDFNLFVGLFFFLLLTKFSWFRLSFIVVLWNEFFLKLNIWIESRKTWNTRFQPWQHIRSHVNNLVLFIKVVKSRQLVNLASYVRFLVVTVDLHRYFFLACLICCFIAW